jgi:hypothetical protein
MSPQDARLGSEYQDKSSSKTKNELMCANFDWSLRRKCEKERKWFDLLGSMNKVKVATASL